MFLRYMQNFATWLRNNKYPAHSTNPKVNAALQKIERPKTSRKTSSNRESGDLDTRGDGATIVRKARIIKCEGGLLEDTSIVTDALATLRLRPDSFKVYHFMLVLPDF